MRKIFCIVSTYVESLMQKGARLGFSGRRGVGQYFSHSQSREILRKKKTCFQKD
jgi:hypothetical protein